MCIDRLLRFMVLAHQLAQKCLPQYAHKFSPRKYTLPQLAACVLLKHYMRLDWRGAEAILKLSPPLQQTIGLTQVPDYTSLWKFACRWMGQQMVSQLLGKLLQMLGLEVVDVAVDSTGLDPGRTSSYYMARRKQSPAPKRYLKLSLSVVIPRMRDHWWLLLLWLTGDRVIPQARDRAAAIAV